MTPRLLLAFVAQVCLCAVALQLAQVVVPLQMLQEAGKICLGRLKAACAAASTVHLLHHQTETWSMQSSTGIKTCHNNAQPDYISSLHRVLFSLVQRSDH